jgi:hypothetical protein
MTLIAETLLDVINWLTHPMITTQKSRTFHTSLMYECGLKAKPRAMILITISIVNII